MSNGKGIAEIYLNGEYSGSEFTILDVNDHGYWTGDAVYYSPYNINCDKITGSPNKFKISYNRPQLYGNLNNYNTLQTKNIEYIGFQFCLGNTNINTHPNWNINSFIFGATFGFLWLSTVPATSGIVAHMFGTKYLGLLYGIVFLSHQIGSFFGAYLGGLFHDLYGSYDYAWYLAIALSVFAAIIHLPIKEQPVLRLKTE